MALPSQVRILPPPLNKDLESRERHTGARTTLSRNHQITIPRSQFEAAELSPGDRFQVIANGPGRIELTRVDELAGQLALAPQ
jgi:hypothetical protein